MIRKQNKRMSTETMVLASLMTALVVVFQCLATYTAFFGPFSTAIGQSGFDGFMILINELEGEKKDRYARFKHVGEVIEYE